MKVRAVRTYLAGASLRETAWALRTTCSFSHEAVRQWVQRMAHLFERHVARHDIVVIDETSVFVEDGREVFVWAALDAETQESIATWVSQGRGGLEAYLFVKAVLDRCRNTPQVLVDRGVWYPWALEALEVPWTVVQGGYRSLVESYFGSFKHRLQKMRRRPGTWHTESSLRGLVRVFAWYWNQRRTNA